MKERPILFSGPMVRAILDGRKTQTRRVVKPQPGEEWCPEVGMVTETLVDRAGEAFPGRTAFGVADEGDLVFSPYGSPGSKLWVREAFRIRGGDEYAYQQHQGSVVYREECDIIDSGPWRPSIFMPRWASRITLEITAVRVERVQDITEEDAEAEGVYGPIFRGSFSGLWDSINSKRGFSWSSNPWVWVITFKRLEGGAK